MMKKLLPIFCLAFTTTAMAQIGKKPDLDQSDYFCPVKIPTKAPSEFNSKILTTPGSDSITSHMLIKRPFGKFDRRSFVLQKKLKPLKSEAVRPKVWPNG